MSDGSRRSWVRAVLAYVLVPGLVVALLASVIAFRLGRADVRVSGTVSLSVLAGNEYDYLLNAYVSDFDEALASPQVTRAVQAAVGPGAVRGLRGERADEASEVSLQLTATSERAGTTALLVAGGTALRLLAQDQEQELVEEESSVRQALERRLAAGERLADEPPPPSVLDPDLLDPLRAARERAVDRALADLAEVQGELAVVRELLSAQPVPGVRVDDVAHLDPVARALRTSVSAGLAAALFGGLVLYSRHGERLLAPARPSSRRAPRPPRDGDVPAGSPTGAGQEEDGRPTVDGTAPASA